MSDYWVTVIETGIVSEACFDPRISNYVASPRQPLIDDDDTDDDDGDDDGAPKKQILWVEEIDPRT